MSHGFPFVESGYIVNDGPGYPRVKGMCNNVDGSGQWVLSCKPGPPAVNVVTLWGCACQVAGWPCLELAVPVVKRHWCANDAWVKRVSSEKITCGTWSSLFSLPVKELEFNQIGSTDRENGEVFKSGSTGI